MKSLVALPLNSVLQTLCSMNFVLNGEKLSIADITIYGEEQLKLSDELNADETQKSTMKQILYLTLPPCIIRLLLNKRLWILSVTEIRRH